ncbi:MAG TPA: TIGR03067 domain-containing protein [Gemmata sp.]
MIRFVLLGSLLLALGARGAAGDKKEVPKELAPFQGTWKVVRAEVDGKAVPEKEFEGGRFTFEGSKLTILEDEKSKPDVGTFAVDVSKEPFTIDMVQSDSEKALGIYKFDKDGKLTLCFGKGKDAPRPKAFDDKKAAFVVLEKVKK